MTIDEIIKLAREADPFCERGKLYQVAALTPENLARFAELVRNVALEEAASVTGEFAKKWWSIHCATNKHMETTRKAHDDFCALQAAIRLMKEPGRRYVHFNEPVLVPKHALSDMPVEHKVEQGCYDGHVYGYGDENKQ